MHRRLRDILLGAWGRFVVRRASWVVAAALALTVISVVVTALALEFHGDRSDLVDPELPWNRRYADYRARFARWDDVRIVIDGPPDDPAVDDAARAIAETLDADPAVAHAESGFAARHASPALFRLAPTEEFQATLAQLMAAQQLAAAPDAVSGLTTALQAMASARDEPGAAQRFEAMLEPYLDALRGADQAPDFGWMRPADDTWVPFRNPRGSGRLRFVNVQFAGAGKGIDRVSTDLERVRSVARAQLEGTGYEWGVTGIPAIEADETRQSIRDSTIASIVALLLITVLMRIAFGGVLLPLLGALALLAGVSWSFLWVVVTVGHLQLLSVVFTVILLGLGIDFVLHTVTRLEMRTHEGHELQAVMGRVFRGVGPGLLTGAITTAAAFGATAFTEFRGMAEMGLIAAGGVVLCLVATLSIFPALLALSGRGDRLIRHRECPEGHFGGGALEWVDRHARTVVVVGVLAAAVGIVTARGLRYDPNVLNLQPPDIESVEWEAKLVQDDAAGAWAALVETTPEAAPALVERLRALPQVGAVDGMGMLVPLEPRENILRSIRSRTFDVPPGGGRQALRTLLAGVGMGLQEQDDPALAGVAERVNAALVASLELDEDAWSARAATLDAAFDAARTELADYVDRALAPGPLTADDLPAALRAQWTADGSWLLVAAPVVDPEGRSVLEPELLDPFVAAVRSVAPDALGPPIQIHESTRLIVRAYIQAAVYAVAAILVLLFLDFRSLPDALCAMLPVTFGFIGVLAVMAACDMPLNFANIIVLPLIFGIGVDAGVHVVHRWHHERHLRPAGLGGGTGRGVLLTMLTTMIGFGSMLIAHHRGIRSLGFVMVVGLAITLVACMTVLPALLRVRTGAGATDATAA